MGSNARRLTTGGRKFVPAILLSAALIAIGYWQFMERIHRSSVDFSMSGVLTGRMTKLADWNGHVSTCFVGKVQGTDQWDANFTGTLNESPVEVDIALVHYNGPGTYRNDGIPDAQTLANMSMGSFAGGRLDMVISLTSLPPGALDAKGYSTETDPAHRPKSPEQLARLAGLGQASLTLDGDERSGRVQALLMNAKAPTSAPVRLDGSFKCGTLERRADS